MRLRQVDARSTVVAARPRNSVQGCRETRMSKVVRYEFLGSWFLFWFQCVTVIGIPMGLLYLMSRTVRVDTEIENPEEFVIAWRAGKT